MINQDYIKGVIDHEISSEIYHDAAINILGSVLQYDGPKTTLTISEIAELSGFALTNDQCYELAFKLVNLSIPIFKVIVELYDEYGSHSYQFIDAETLSKVLMKAEIVDPDSGEDLAFQEYKTRLSFIFEVNNYLFKKL